MNANGINPSTTSNEKISKDQKDSLNILSKSSTMTSLYGKVINIFSRDNNILRRYNQEDGKHHLLETTTEVPRAHPKQTGT